MVTWKSPSDGSRVLPLLRLREKPAAPQGYLQDLGLARKKRGISFCQNYRMMTVLYIRNKFLFILVLVKPLTQPRRRPGWRNRRKPRQAPTSPPWDCVS